MSANEIFRRIKTGEELAVNGGPSQIKVSNFSCQIIGVCSCGNPLPMVFHFIPGLTVTVKCKKCLTEYHVQGMNANITGEAAFQIVGKPPVIAPASAIFWLMPWL